ncbi:Gfo/Idh/MocA family protein [Rhodocaloribacter sp.]
MLSFGRRARGRGVRLSLHQTSDTMRVGVIGTGKRAERRARVLRTRPGTTFAGFFAALPDDPAPPGLDAFLDQTEAVFITVPTGAHFRMAEAAAKRGAHCFLEWPPATSIRECEAMLHLAEEAGVEVGVSRPLRFHPLFATLPAAWQPGLIVLTVRAREADPRPWPHRLADAVDLCAALARSGSAQRIDAEAVRGAGARPEAVAFTLRFHNGALAQVCLGRFPLDHRATVYVAGGDLHRTFDLDEEATAGEGPENAGASEALERPGLASPEAAETHAFLTALAEKRPPPVSLLDGLHTMRLVERLMERLR